MLILCLAIVIIGCGKEEPKEAQDLESIRADLREQVERGKLTREEAIVKLAEAQAKAGFYDKDKEELSEEMEELTKDLKEQVASGEMTEEEAKEAWMEVFEKDKDESGDK